MTVNACYWLSLYCDVKTCSRNTFGPTDFTAEKGTTARQQARTAGWRFDWRNGVATCPTCVKNGKRATKCRH